MVRANAAAGVDLRKLSRPGPRLPPWRIVSPRPAAELLAAYHDAEAALGVPWAYLAAINVVETRTGRIRGASPAGALYAYNHSPLYVRAVTAYAEQMHAAPRAFLGYRQWQVYCGDTLLPEGYPARPAVAG